MSEEVKCYGRKEWGKGESGVLVCLNGGQESSCWTRTRLKPLEAFPVGSLGGEEMVHRPTEEARQRLGEARRQRRLEAEEGWHTGFCRSLWWLVFSPSDRADLLMAHSQRSNVNLLEFFKNLKEWKKTIQWLGKPEDHCEYTQSSFKYFIFLFIQYEVF